GGGKRNNIPAFSPIPLKWQAMGLSSADMELLESDKQDVKTIARQYNVPLALVDNAAATHDNIITSNKELYEKAIIPELISLRDDINNEVVRLYNEATNKKYWVDFDLKTVACLQEDMKAKSEIHLKEQAQGNWTVNEYKQLMDYDFDSNDPLGNYRIVGNNLRFISPDMTIEEINRTKPADNATEPNPPN